MKYLLCTICLFLVYSCHDQKEPAGLRMTTSDESLQKVFDWAQTMALSYVSAATDPVGPWYEASLPQRQAFCMRDVSHQSGGGEALGLSKENFNMFAKFVENISASKDWCTYWEINKENLPAPVDYRNDKEFWYNLNANFDVLDACYRTYLWTGDLRYVNGPAFLFFYEKTMTDYLEQWQLRADQLMSRPRFLNTPEPFNPKDNFHTCRGLPSYVENFEGLSATSDLIASIYRACLSYAEILKLQGKTDKASQYVLQAQSYANLLESEWWDSTAELYQTFWTESKEFHKGEGETFILWFGAATDPYRVKKTIEHLLSLDLNVENLSYFPQILYRYQYNQEAYDKMIHLSTVKRNEYPEVSYGVIEGMVSGLAGIKVDAANNKITTLSRLTPKTEWVQLDHVPVLSGTISVRHEGTHTSFLENNTGRPVIWKAVFPGSHASVQLLGGSKQIPKQANTETDVLDNVFSYVEIELQPKESFKLTVHHQ